MQLDIDAPRYRQPKWFELPSNNHSKISRTPVELEAVISKIQERFVKETGRPINKTTAMRHYVSASCIDEKKMQELISERKRRLKRRPLP